MIALAKIVGFEVAPVTAQSAISARELAAVEQLARKRVEPDRDAGVVQLLEAVHATLPSAPGTSVLERHAGIGEAAVVDGDALADQPLDRVRDIPDVDVHARPRRGRRSARRR